MLIGNAFFLSCGFSAIVSRVFGFYCLYSYALARERYKVLDVDDLFLSRGSDPFQVAVSARWRRTGNSGCCCQLQKHFLGTLPASKYTFS